MEKTIGPIAGQVWNTLHENGEITLTNLYKGVSTSQSNVAMALGWLAREGKITSRKEGRRTYISLVS
jgi:DNA-binding transcriptional ArsR family regulator